MNRHATLRATCTRDGVRVEAWHEGDRFREEWASWPVLVADPPRWWAQWEPGEVVVNDGRDPDFYLAPRLGLFRAVPDYCDFRTVGRTQRAGREALVVEATEVGEDARRLPERRVLEVDAELGVLLAVTSDVGRTVVESIEFDVEHPPGTFEYEVPPSVQVVDARAPMCRYDR